VKSITGGELIGSYYFSNEKYRRLGGGYSMIKRITKLVFAIVSGVVVAAAAAQALHLAT
jgi:hypothetical protein